MPGRRQRRPDSARKFFGYRLAVRRVYPYATRRLPMTTNAAIGHGSNLRNRLRLLAGSYVALDEVRNITPPTLTLDSHRCHAYAIAKSLSGIHLRD